jgi:hypothetical protein
VSFQEKSTALMLGLLVVVYGWYFAVVGSRALAIPVAEVEYRAMMLVTVVALVAVAIVGHVLIAVLAPREADVTDERDRLVDLRGEWIGGFVLGTGTLAGLLLAMAEADTFWIANVLLAGMVLSEIVTSVARLVFYRRGV